MDKICGSCTYLDLGDGNCYGKFYCNKTYDRHLATDPACSRYTKAYSRDSFTIKNATDYSKNHTNQGCYITTLMCDILKLSDSNFYINTLRLFRDNYLSKNYKYKKILVEYDIVGPAICNKLINDKQNQLIAAKIFYNYIKPTVELINDKMYQDAIVRYQMMVEKLRLFYSINSIINQEQIDNSDISKSGHGRYQKVIKK